MGSSAAIRGREATLSISVGTRRFTLLTKSFRENFEFELVKDRYIGERTSRPNPNFDGVMISWENDEDDASALELAQTLMDAEEAGLEPPKATVTATYKYRKAGVGRRIVTYNCTLAPKSRDNGDQKENIKTSFEGYSQKGPKVLRQ